MTHYFKRYFNEADENLNGIRQMQIFEKDKY